MRDAMDSDTEIVTEIGANRVKDLYRNG